MKKKTSLTLFLSTTSPSLPLDHQLVVFTVPHVDPHHSEKPISSCKIQSVDPLILNNPNPTAFPSQSGRLLKNKPQSNLPTKLYATDLVFIPSVYENKICTFAVFIGLTLFILYYTIFVSSQSNHTEFPTGLIKLSDSDRTATTAAFSFSSFQFSSDGPERHTYTRHTTTLHPHSKTCAAFLYSITFSSELFCSHTVL